MNHKHFTFSKGLRSRLDVCRQHMRFSIKMLKFVMYLRKSSMLNALSSIVINVIDARRRFYSHRSLISLLLIFFMVSLGMQQILRQIWIWHQTFGIWIWIWTCMQCLNLGLDLQYRFGDRFGFGGLGLDLVWIWSSLAQIPKDLVRYSVINNSLLCYGWGRIRKKIGI